MRISVNHKKYKAGRENPGMVESMFLLNIMLYAQFAHVHGFKTKSV